jgi:hypothetical protein
MEKSDVVEQTKLAFDFIQRLYLETSYFIKEVEGMLQQEEEEFTILKPAGYAISAFRSVGLESALVEQWCIRKGAVFFVAKDDTDLVRGQTVTKIKPNLKLIVVRFVLNDKDLDAPEVWAGVVSGIAQKKEYSKFEYHIWKFVYHEKKIFRGTRENTYEDNECSFNANLFKRPLYDISNAEDIQREIVKPVLTIYRGK